MIYSMFSGSHVGQPDDDANCEADSHQEALEKAIAWADEQWPTSDSFYDAVVWIELFGEVVAQEDVTIDANGYRV